MEIEDKQELIANDNEYKKGLIKNPIIENERNEIPPSEYNPSIFQPNIIINCLQSKEYLKIYKSAQFVEIQ